MVTGVPEVLVKGKDAIVGEAHGSNAIAIQVEVANINGRSRRNLHNSKNVIRKFKIPSI